MGIITSENAAVALVEMVANTFLPTLVGNLVMGNLVTRNFGLENASVGDVVNIPIPGTATANNIAETGSIQPQVRSLGNAQITLNTHLESSFQLGDIARVLAGDTDLLALNMQPAIIACAEKIETDLLSMYSYFSNSAGASNAAISEAVVDEAEADLFSAKIPKGLPLYMVLHGTPYKTLRNLTRFSETQTIGTAEAIRTGQLPMVKGFNVLRTQYGPSPGSVYHGMGFTPGAIGLAMRALPIPTPGKGVIGAYANYNGFGMRVLSSYNHTTLSETYSVDVFYGAAVIRREFGVDIISNG